MKIIFAGTTPNAAQVLQYLVSQGRHEICAVITREDAPKGRKKVLTPSAVADAAQSAKLTIIKTNHITPDIDTKLSGFEADLGLVIAYGALLRKRTLEIPAHGWFNIHYSLLPKWRGAAPVQRSLMSGDAETGVTIFKLDEGMDTGDILDVAPTAIETDEDSATLLERLTRLAISMLDHSLASIESGIAKLTPQSGEASIAPKLSREECRIDWTQSATAIENMVRGANPEPVAWSTLDGETFRVIRSRSTLSHEPDAGLSIGEAVANDKRVLVCCGEGMLQLLEVQPASKNRMPASDWFRGRSGKVIFQ